MCGRFVSATDRDGLVRFFVVDEREADELPASWNVAPTDPAYGVVQRGGRRLLRVFRWGLVPRWASDDAGGARLINARDDSVADSPAFRDSFRRRRCLVPANGFYEWEKTGGLRLPWYFQRSDGQLLALAGIEARRGHLRTCAVITTAANGDVEAIHDRMPVLLERDDWDAWLAADTDPDEAQRLLTPPPDGALHRYRVSTEVNSSRAQGPQLIVPEEPQPTLF
ncbi:MAG: SOS response-associated peptidase [Actinobacteria bacterium]|nr:SOS response-associated peptidase [Actinomycetota bacterium]